MALAGEPHPNVTNPNIIQPPNPHLPWIQLSQEDRGKNIIELCFRYLFDLPEVVAGFENQYTHNMSPFDELIELRRIRRNDYRLEDTIKSSVFHLHRNKQSKFVTILRRIVDRAELISQEHIPDDYDDYLDALEQAVLMAMHGSQNVQRRFYKIVADEDLGRFMTDARRIARYKHFYWTDLDPDLTQVVTLLEEPQNLDNLAIGPRARRFRHRRYPDDTALLTTARQDIRMIIDSVNEILGDVTVDLPTVRTTITPSSEQWRDSEFQLYFSDDDEGPSVRPARATATSARPTRQHQPTVIEDDGETNEEDLALYRSLQREIDQMDRDYLQQQQQQHSNPAHQQDVEQSYAVLVPAASSHTQSLQPFQPTIQLEPPTRHTAIDDDDDSFLLSDLIDAEIASRRQDESQTAAALAPERARHAELMQNVRNFNEAVAQGVAALSGTSSREQASTSVIDLDDEYDEVVDEQAPTSVIDLDDEDDEVVDLNEEEDEWTQQHPYTGPSTIFVPIAINQPTSLSRTAQPNVRTYTRPSQAVLPVTARLSRAAEQYRSRVLGGDIRILPEQAFNPNQPWRNNRPPPALRFKIGDLWYRRQMLLRRIENNPDPIVEEMFRHFSNMRFERQLGQRIAQLNNRALADLFLQLAANQIRFATETQFNNFEQSVLAYLRRTRPVFESAGNNLQSL